MQEKAIGHRKIALIGTKLYPPEDAWWSIWWNNYGMQNLSMPPSPPNWFSFWRMIKYSRSLKMLRIPPFCFTVIMVVFSTDSPDSTLCTSACTVDSLLTL